ncbi:MAG: ParB/RepB/Spo0J family partition protein [Oscillospiraceae bacterium]|nr:ParB/RepB/Spo0J family partition protein [Oscillospiraceae bacterium]
MARKTGLGSGISSLFVDNALDISVNNGDISVLRITHIEPKKTQPRKDFRKESLAELADSIAKHGIIQPIIVRSLPSGYYQIIAGERRWRAAKMAGLDEVPVVIKNVDELTAAEMTMVENLQREDLNPIEEALGYKYLVDHYNLTQEEISRQVAKSRSVVANALRLLSLPEEVLKYIEDGDITSGHARAILSVDDPEEQLKIAQKIIKNNLSVRETEKIVRAKKSSFLSGDNNIDIDEYIYGESTDEKAGIKDKDLANSKKVEELYLKNLQNKISGIFGKKIIINMAKNNKNGAQSGKLEIEYKNNEELESIIKVLCGGNNIFES